MAAPIISTIPYRRINDLKSTEDVPGTTDQGMMNEYFINDASLFRLESSMKEARRFILEDTRPHHSWALDPEEQERLVHQVIDGLSEEDGKVAVDDVGSLWRKWRLKSSPLELAVKGAASAATEAGRILDRSIARFAPRETADEPGA
jgi:hypothetical protein